MIVNSGSATWQGSIERRRHRLDEIRRVEDQPFGFKTRFEGAPGTNPEELIGAAHAACFSMALSLVLGNAGVTDVQIETTSKIGLDQDGGGFFHQDRASDARISGKGDKAVIETAGWWRKTVQVCKGARRYSCPDKRRWTTVVMFGARKNGAPIIRGPSHPRDHHFLGRGL